MSNTVKKPLLYENPKYQKTSKNSNTQYKSKTKATQKQEIKIQQSNNSIIEEKEMGSYKMLT